MDSSAYGAQWSNNACLRPIEGTADGGPGLCTCPQQPGGAQTSCIRGGATNPRAGGREGVEGGDVRGGA